MRKISIKIFIVITLLYFHPKSFGSLNEDKEEGKQGVYLFPINDNVENKRLGILRLNYQGTSYYDHKNPGESYDIINVITNVILKPAKEGNNFYKIILHSSIGELIDYSPSTSGVITSYSTGRNWESNSSVGIFGDIPTIGFGQSEGYNNSTSQTLPEVQVLSNMHKNDVTWQFRIQGHEESNYDFKIGLNTSWKVHHNYRDATSPALCDMPLHILISSGKILSRVLDENDQEQSDLTSRLKHLMPMNPIGILAGQIGKIVYPQLFEQHHDVQKFKIVTEIVAEADKVLLKQDTLIPLPLRQHSWFLSEDQIISGKFLPNVPFDELDLSITQKGELIYSTYRLKDDLKIIYSDDNYSWHMSDSKLPRNFSFKDQFLSKMIFNGEKLVFLSSELINPNQSSKQEHYMHILENGSKDWITQVIRAPINALIGITPVHYKNRLYLAYQDEETRYPYILYNIRGEEFTAPKQMAAKNLTNESLSSNIELVATKNRLYACYATKKHEVVLLRSENGYFNWKATILQDTKLADSNFQNIYLLKKKGLLHLLYENASIIYMHQYSMKTNKWNPHVNAFNTHLLEYPIDTLKYSFDAAILKGFGSDDSKICLYSQGIEGEIITSYIINETEREKYLDI